MFIGFVSQCCGCKNGKYRYRMCLWWDCYKTYESDATERLLQCYFKSGFKTNEKELSGVVSMVSETEILKERFYNVFLARKNFEYTSLFFFLE